MLYIYLGIGFALGFSVAGLWIVRLQHRLKRAEDELAVFKKVVQIKQKRFIDDQVNAVSELDKAVKRLASLAEKKKASVNWDDELKGLKR